jgi:hypothetical protein
VLPSLPRPCLPLARALLYCSTSMNDDEHVGKDILVYSPFFQKKTGPTRVCFVFGSDSESVLLG